MSAVGYASNFWVLVKATGKLKYGAMPLCAGEITCLSPNDTGFPDVEQSSFWWFGILKSVFLTADCALLLVLIQYINAQLLFNFSDF